ncbi:MAG: tetratricopeptide repeat protein [Deltaproteobacteria bacterium]|nr:MAG: tetratricopeptide repeat protein [Deltaproteobacteria bacterium]
MEKKFMNMFFKIFLTGGLVFFLMTPESAAINLSRLVKKVQPAVVTILTFDLENNPSGIGSGFFIDKQGHLITNYHVLKGSYSAVIRTYKGSKYPITAILAENEETDLIKVLVDIPKKEISPVVVVKDLPSIAERIIVVGSPLGLDQTVSEGIVSSIRNMPNIGDFFQMSAPISPGSSGSPVINMKGKVVGIASFQAAVGQNLNFAVSGKSVIGLKPNKKKKTIAEWAFSISGENPKIAEELCRKGFQHSINGDYNKALHFYKKATEEDPGDERAWFGLGYCYVGLGKPADAIHAYKQAIKMNPRNASAYNNLAKYYNNIGRHEDAIETYRKVIQIDSEFGPAYFNLGLLYAKLGRFNEGKESFKQALRIDPSDASAHYYMGITCGKLGQYQEALEAHKEALQIEPDLAPAHYNMGLVYGELKKFEEEIKAYKQAIRVDPDYAPAHYKLGERYVALGDINASLAQYKILMDLDRDMANHLFDLIYH